MAEPEQKGPYAAFGEWLRTQRLNAKLTSQTLAVQRANSRKIKGINQGKISYIERGMNGDPDPDFLAKLAELYGITYAAVVREWSIARFGIANVAETPTAQPVVVRSDANEADFYSVPLMRDRIAAGQPLSIEDANTSGALVFSTRFVRKWLRPICVRVGPREESMIPAIMPNDVVLLECADAARLTPKPDEIYAVRHEGGATLKRVEFRQEHGQSLLVLTSENPNKKLYGAQFLWLEEDASVLDYVIGRVVWRGQYV